jgi:hypothetical protein
MTMADGRYLEQFVFVPGGKVLRSKYKFLQEISSKKDQEIWFNFWHNYTATGDKAHTPLGKWTAPTHRRWIRYYDCSSKDLQRIKVGKFHHYLPASDHCQTRLTTTYQLIWEEDISPIFKRGAFTSVVGLTNNTINRLNEGASLAKGPPLTTNFWEFLNTWGGRWMWEGIDESQPTKHNLIWMVERMKSNTLIRVTDGSYNRKRAADLCGVGWIIFCSKTGLRLTATFWEKTISASSYWVEMLGLCALHLLARAFLEFYMIQGWKATLCCNNKRVLELSLYSRRRIRPSAKCADIQQSLKATKHTFTGKFTYLHVHGHMDKYLLWHQLSLIQQLNCICNTLAKQAVTSAMTEGPYKRQLNYYLERT